MTNFNLLNEAYLAIVRSTAFIDSVLKFLRKRQRLSDAAIRLATDKLLVEHARKFCRSHLDRFFPELKTSDPADARLLFEEVVFICKNLRADLLNKARLRRPPAARSQGSSPIESEQEVSQFLPLPSAAVASPDWKLHPRDIVSQPRSQGISHKIEAATEMKFEVSPQVAKTKQHKTEAKQSTKSQIEAWPKSTIYDQRVEKGDGTTSSASSQNNLDAAKALGASFHEVVEQIVCLKDSNRQYQLEVERLRTQNKTLASYQMFVDTTIRVCKDTHREEARSAQRVGIHSLANNHNAVVEVLRDLSSDLDFTYFNDYYLLEKHAPPSRFWLNTVERSGRHSAVPRMR